MGGEIIKMKGTRTGLELSFAEGVSYPKIEMEVITRLESIEGFFTRGTEVFVPRGTLPDMQMARLKKIFNQHGLRFRMDELKTENKSVEKSSKTVEKARVVLKEASEEQKEAIRKEELSVNQVYNQIRGKASFEKPESNQPKLSAKEKAFIDGIRYAIAQINSGICLKDLYHQTTDNFDYSKMIASLKDVDFEKLFTEPESPSVPEEA